MNLNRIFEGLLGSGVAGSAAGGAAAALLVQGPGSKKGGKMAGRVATPGGAAVVGALAWKAYERYRDSDGSGAGTAGDAPVPAWRGLDEEQFAPRSSAPAARRDLLVLRAMITAAHADGHIDTEERLRIYGRIEALDLSHAEKGLLLEEIASPLSLEALAEQVPNRALAAEVYLGAVLMLAKPSASDRRFLEALAEQLALPVRMVRSLEAALPGEDTDSIENRKRSGRGRAAA